MKTLLVSLFFPFVFFVFWGPFVFFHVARKVVGRLRMRHEPQDVIVRSFVILMTLFMPVAVTSPGGSIPAILPWWIAVLGMWFALETGVEFSAGSFVPAILAATIAWWVISREVRRGKAVETK